MQFKVMDATKMDFQDEEFDLVIDKGTLDALICGPDLEIPCKLIIEMMRVTKKKNGKIILISHGSPEGRRIIFKNTFGFKNFTYLFSK